MSDCDSSSDENIVREQARKLFRQCDSDHKGYVVKDDLGSIADLVPARDFLSLERAVEKSEESFISEAEFIRMISSIVALSSQQETPILTSRTEETDVPLGDVSCLISSGAVPSLADELSSARPADKYHDPITDMLKEHLASPYPFVVENYTTPNELPTIYEQYENPVVIQKPHFRPIEPDSYGSARTVPAQSLADDMRTPDRIFKVVFVGDSAVGKTCFLHRFCHNRFKPLFNATIGVDFTVKTIPLRDRLVALQLWDTAGQERFRSITKQYFRKADGVILMFDVTSEQSLLNVRNWIDSVRAGVDEKTVMCLVGNKVDLFGNDNSRNGVYRAGKRLAEEFSMNFFETSAFTGYGIEHCMRSMAESLQKREEDHLEEALRLEANPPPKRRSWCCL